MRLKWPQGNQRRGGLYERIAFSAYFLWLLVLAVALWRRPAIKDRDGDLEHRMQATETI
jgi:hypothetical protein